MGFSKGGLAIDEDLDPNDNLDEDEFLSEFGEVIEDPAEIEKRAKALKKHEEEVKRINREYIEGKSQFFEKINPYSDLPDDEFRKERTGVIITPQYSRGVLIANLSEVDEESERYFDQFRFSRESVPSSYSSVENGHVTSIKHQGVCGSCCAFASTATMETVFAKITGKLADYSEQELLDCGFDRVHAKGCDGAQIYAYFKWLAVNKRQPMHESFFPYKHNLNYFCPPQKPYNIGAKIRDTYYTFSGNEDMLKKLVAQHGAVVITTVTDDNWANYGGGVLDRCKSTDLTKKENKPHAVSVVGYGSEMANGRMTDFWLIKNSWSTDWGSDGYIKVKRGYGLCGIGKHISVLVAETNPEPLSDPLPEYEICLDFFKTCPKIAETKCNEGKYWRAHCCKSCKSVPIETEEMKKKREEEEEKRRCEDDSSDKFCSTRGVKNCKKYAKQCKKSCGLCIGMTPHVSYTCPDESQHCHKQVENYCWMYGNTTCRLSCGNCEGMTPEPSNFCYDQAHSCKKSQCKTQRRWASRNCKRTCGLCECKDERSSSFCSVEGVANCKDNGHDCKKTCGLCQGMTPHISNTCPDTAGGSWCKNKVEKKCWKYGESHCRYSCGLCEGMTPADSNTKPCYDKTQCRQSQCNKWPEWMARNCAKTCGKC